MKKEVPLEKAHRLLNTGCVLLVTSAYQERSNIMTLAWQTPLSGRPPRIGIAVALPHFTCELINKSMEFVLNIPGADLLEQVDRCGRISGRTVDKFKEAGLTPVTAQKVQAPLIKECLGHLECGVVDSTRQHKGTVPLCYARFAPKNTRGLSLCVLLCSQYLYMAAAPVVVGILS